MSTLAFLVRFLAIGLVVAMPRGGAAAAETVGTATRVEHQAVGHGVVHASGVHRGRARGQVTFRDQTRLRLGRTHELLVIDRERI